MGDFWIVIDGTGEPVCVIRTLDVRIVAFDEMPEDYALWGGEGDLSMEFWRRIYWKYIVTECARIGRTTGDKAPLVMERFTVVYREPLQPH